METEEMLDEAGEDTETASSTKLGVGFVSGMLFGILLGAGVALLFAPDEGEKTRGRLRKQMSSLKDDAREGIDRAGSRTREELLRRQSSCGPSSSGSGSGPGKPWTELSLGQPAEQRGAFHLIGRVHDFAIRQRLHQPELRFASATLFRSA